MIRKYASYSRARDDSPYQTAVHLSNRLTPHAGDDEFRGGLSPQWASITSGGATNTLTCDGDALSVLCSGGSAGAFGGAVNKPITIAAGGYIETCMRIGGDYNTVLPTGGVYVADAATNTAAILAVTFQEHSTLEMWKSTFDATTSQTSSNKGVSGWKMPFIFMRLVWVSANTWSWRFSLDGVSWDAFSLSNQSRTLTPTHMGLCWSQFGSDISEFSFEYFRCSG